MNSKEYWKKREAANLVSNLKQEKAYERELDRIYRDMLDGVQKEIESFYARYASKEGISIAEARKAVSQLDIEAYERKAKRYVKDKDMSKIANEEMRLYNLTMKVNRLEMLKANIGLEMIKGHAELETFMGKILRGRTEAELKRQAGILGKSVRNNAQLANSIVNASYKNATFSQRVWMYHGQMKADVGKLLENGLIQGKGVRQLTKELEKYYIGEPKLKNGRDGAQFAAERLMRTELARVQTDAQKQSFERNGFERYTFIVNSGCCSICEAVAKKNNGHYKVKDMMPGDNAPPMHPFCRCSVAAYEDSDEYNAWLDFLDKGNTTEAWNALDPAERKRLVEKYKAQQQQEALKPISRELPKIEYDIETNGLNTAKESATLEQVGENKYKVSLKAGEKIAWDDISADAKQLIDWKAPKRRGEAFTIPKGDYDVQPYVKGSTDRAKRDEIGKQIGGKYVGTSWFKKYGTYFEADFYEKDGRIVYSLGKADVKKTISKESLKKVAQITREREAAILEKLKQNGVSISQLTKREGNDWADAMKVYHKIIGADGLPDIVSKSEYDAIKSPALYRGIAPASRLRQDIKTKLTTQQMADGFFKDASPFPSRGVYGDGIAYCSPSRDKIGAMYASGGGKISNGGKIIEFKLKNNAKTIQYSDAVELFESMQGQTDGSLLFNKNQAKTLHEVGKAMNALGFDAIIEENGDRTGVPFYVILNRNALVATEEWTAVTITPQYLKRVQWQW